MTNMIGKGRKIIQLFLIFALLLFGFNSQAQPTKKVNEALFIKQLQKAKADTTKNRICMDWADAVNADDPEKAITLWKKVEALAKLNLEKLKSTDPAHRVFKTQLEFSMSWQGSLLQEIGEFKEAIVCLGESVRLKKELYDMSKNSDEKAHVGVVLNSMGDAYKSLGKFDDAKNYYLKSLRIREEMNDSEAMCTPYENIGFIYMMKGEPDKCMEYFTKSLKIKEARGDKKAICLTLSNIGEINRRLGNIPIALSSLTKCRTILEEEVTKKDSLKFAGQLATCILNLGTLYQTMKDNRKASELFLQTLEIQQRYRIKKGLAGTYNCLGLCFNFLGDTGKALMYYSKGLELYQANKNLSGVATILSNMGVIYKNQRKYEKALENYSRAFKINEELNNKEGIISSGMHFSGIYIVMAQAATDPKEKRKLFDKALPYAQRSMCYAKEIGFPESIFYSAVKLIPIYKATGKFKLALEYSELSIKMRDSINNESNRKIAIRSQLKYEYEKKAAADSMLRVKEGEIKNAEMKRQAAEIKAKKNQQYALFGGLALVIIFAVFMYNRFKITQKQKAIIEHQKDMVEVQKTLVEEKQKEVLDSIRYAKRIQIALMPSEKRFFGELKRLRSRN